MNKINPAYAGHFGQLNATPMPAGALYSGDVKQSSIGEIDTALFRIDEKIALLGKYSAEIAEIANALCSPGILQGETGCGNYPQPVATGVREKLDERERRLSTVLENIGQHIDRLREL